MKEKKQKKTAVAKDFPLKQQSQIHFRKRQSGLESMEGGKDKVLVSDISYQKQGSLLNVKIHIIQFQRIMTKISQRR